MSKRRLARYLKVFSYVLTVIAIMLLLVSMYTVTKTLMASLFVEGEGEPSKIEVPSNQTGEAINGKAVLRVFGGGFMSTNASASLKIMDEGGNTLFSRSNRI